jgi:hypothetical protein
MAMNLINTLSDNRTLWITFISTILLTVAFQIAVSVWDLILLDAISDPAEARQAISLMSPDQHAIHAWITATLDVAYPYAYGALFIGSAYKFYGRFGWLFALPAFVLVPIDLVEGVVQVLALTNLADWIDAKAYLTPLKTILFLLGILTTVVGWFIWLLGWMRNS